MSRQIVSAIDAGSSKITTVIAALDEEDQLIKVIGTATTQSSGIKKGVIVNIGEAVEAIQESLEYAEKMAGISITQAFVSVDGKNILSDNKKGVVAIAGEEIGFEDVHRAIESAKSTAIPHQVRKIIHVLHREFIVDSQAGIREPLGMTGSRLEVDAHIISALSTTVHNIEKVFTDVGIRPTPIFAGLASSHSVLTKTEKELGVMVLDIGHGTTDITIYQEDALAYSGCIILGGHAITSDLAVGLQIQSEDAEKLKVNIGKYIDSKSAPKQETSQKSNNIPSFLRSDNSNNSTKNDESDDEQADDLIDISNLNIQNNPKISKRMYEEIVGCRLDEVFQMVVDEISMTGFSYKQPAGIVITGGTSSLYGLAKHCSKFFGVPCRIGTPQGLGGPLIDEITGPEYSCVQGLLLNGVERFSYATGYDEPDQNSGPGVFSKVKNMFKNFMP
jgi:cell division protein FtsA